MALKRSIQRTRTSKIPADSQEDRVKILNFRETQEELSHQQGTRTSLEWLKVQQSQ